MCMMGDNFSVYFLCFVQFHMCKQTESLVGNKCSSATQQDHIRQVSVCVGDFECPPDTASIHFTHTSGQHLPNPSLYPLPLQWLHK